MKHRLATCTVGLLVGSYLIVVASVVATPSQQPRSVAAAAQAKRRLVWVDRQGKEELLAAPPRAYGLPRLSPDARRIAVEIGPPWDLWIYNIADNSLVQFTSDGNTRFPLWTPDGKRVVFGSVSGPGNVFWKAADGSGAPERLAASEHPLGPQSWSPDGKILSFYEIHPQTGRDIWMLPMQGERKPWVFLRTPALEGGAVFSPDGHWLAYISDESGSRQVYVQPFPGPGERRQVSVGGGVEPMWAHTGRELFFRDGDKRMSVEIVTEPALSVGLPKVLFEAPFQNSPGTRANYDVAPDDRRLLMVRAEP